MSTDCLNVFDHFEGLALKGLKDKILPKLTFFLNFGDAWMIKIFKTN